MEMDGTPFPSVTSAPEAWDAISDDAKLQIFAFIGFLEFVSFKSDFNPLMLECCIAARAYTGLLFALFYY
jgi:hypothetical protein